MPSPSEQLDQAQTLLDELEQVQRQLDQMRNSLTRSHRLATLGTIATIIAHEFNNILTPVISYCQLARRQPDNHDLMVKAVAKSHDGATKAAQICASLLGFAREEQSEGPTKLIDAVTEVFQCLARDPKKDGITLKIDVPDETWLAINPIALQQVLLNLVLNARRAIGRSGGRLTIAARTDGPQTVITVADTGRGIAPEMLADIFKPFVSHRPDNGDPADSQRGTGLGLAICRDLIERADGRITVQSTPGKGATFTITLPTAQPR